MVLYIKQRVFSLGDTYRVYDVNQEPVFEVRSEIFTLGAKIHLYNMAGKELFYIKRRLPTLLPAYEIYAGSCLCADIRKEWSFFRPRLTVSSGYGNFELEGDFWDMDFTIRCAGQTLGSIQKEWFSWGDAYQLDIADERDMAFFTTMVIAIDNCLHNENQ